MPAKQKKLIIWGAGGHASVVADIIRQGGTREIIGFVEDVTRGRRPRTFLNVRVIRDRNQLAGVLRAGAREMIIAIGDCEARLHLAGVARRMGFRLGLAIHPRATVAPTARIGAGSVVAAGAVICPGAVIGKNVIINTAASVDHDCVLEDGVHICPGVHLAGSVIVGRGAWVGIGATAIEGVRIGRAAVIGAGGVVVGDIPDRMLACGVPARVVRFLPEGRPPTLKRK